MSAVPTETEAWILQGQNGVDSLEKVDDHRLPVLGDHDVLIQLHAASLNYRDIAIAKTLYSLPLPNPTIPASDGAGTILTTGPKVTSLHPGDEVCTHLLPHKPFAEPATLPEIAAGLGHGADGTLQRSGVFHESAIVRMPRGLSFLQASALPCAGLTAWNALFGLLGRETRTGALDEGRVVLVQGSGGVSVLAMQFALAAGATVIATTSSPAKAQKLASLGARHVLNYKTDTTWGETAKSLTPDGKGVDVVVDVGGPATLAQSLKAVRPGGLVSITGLLGGGSGAGEATLLDCLVQGCVARGVILGTRRQFEEMNAFIEEKGVLPVVDERVFGFGEVRDAYDYLMGQGHFSKVCIQLDR